jgi:Cell wall-active antibiotics response 4TMS YvqF
MTGSGPLQLRHTFGSTKRTGEWQVPGHVVLRQRMGSAELDFTAAVFETAQVTLELDMIGGSVELRVPEDMHVESTLATTLGSYEDHRANNPVGAAGRSLTIQGRAVWGSVEVRGPKKKLGRRG